MNKQDETTIILIITHEERGVDEQEVNVFSSIADMAESLRKFMTEWLYDHECLGDMPRGEEYDTIVEDIRVDVNTVIGNLKTNFEVKDVCGGFNFKWSSTPFNKLTLHLE